MRLLRKIKDFFKKYLLDTKLRNKVHLIPELVLVIYGLISSKFSIIFYGCLAIALYNLVLNAIAKKIAVKEISKHLNTVSIQTDINNESDEDIINL